VAVDGAQVSDRGNLVSYRRILVMA
jgi:hypothetical protein